MPIRRVLEHKRLGGPEEVERLNRAYRYALRSLHLVDRNDPITELVARKIIEVGATGVRDPSAISKIAVKQLVSRAEAPGCHYLQTAVRWTYSVLLLSKECPGRHVVSEPKAATARS